MLLAVKFGCQSPRSSILCSNLISVIKHLIELEDSLDPHWVMGCHSLQVLSLLDDLETHIFSI